MINTYLQYNIKAIKLDKEGKYLTVGAIESYIDLLGNFSLSSGKYAKYLIIISCADFDNEVLLSIIDKYNNIDDVIVIAEPIPLSRIDENAVYINSTKYNFEIITIDIIFKHVKTCMILNNTLGAEFIKYIKGLH